MSYAFNKLVETFGKEKQRSKKEKDIEWVTETQQEVIALLEVGSKFSKHIERIAHKEDYKEQLVKRVSDAQMYFEPLLTDLIKKIAKKQTLLKGEKGVKTYLTDLKDLQALVQLKLQKVSQIAVFSQAIINNEEYVKEVKKPVTIPKAKKEGSYMITYQLFKDGLFIKNIAEERSLTVASVENHIARCIDEGLLAINNFISEKDIEIIVTEASKMDEITLTELKSRFEEDKYSYFKLKLALSTMQIES